MAQAEIFISTANPEIILTDLSQSTNLKNWGLRLDASNFEIRTLTDAHAELAVPLVVDRNGVFTINNSVNIGTYSVAGHKILSIRGVGQSDFNYDQFGGSWRPALQLVGNDDTTDFLHIISPQTTDPDYNHTLFLSNHGFDFRPGASHANAGSYAIRFNDDGKIILNQNTTSYFYNPSGTNDLAFVTNSIETLRMQNGNVGIGTSPTNKLDVAGNAYVSGTMGIAAAPTTDKLTVGGNTYINGCVGISTSPTIEKLTVGGSIKLVQVGETTPVIFNAGGSLELRAGNGTSVGYDVNIGYGNYNGAKLNFWGGSTSVKMEVSAAGAVKFASYVSAGTAFRINDGVGTSGQVLRSNGSTGFVAGSVAITEVSGFPDQTSQSGKYLTTNGSVLSWGTISAGTVTSVAMTVPVGMSVSGSPITTTGTLAVTFDSQAANKFLASPSGTTGTPSFRSITSSDIPTSLSITDLTASGVVAIGTSPTIEKLTVGGSIRLDYPGSGPTATIFCSNQALQLRAGNGVDTGYNIDIGYGNYNGVDLNFFGGSTSTKFKVYSTGVGFFAGQVSSTYFQPTINYKSVQGYTGTSFSFVIGPYRYDFADGLQIGRAEI